MTDSRLVLMNPPLPPTPPRSRVDTGLWRWAVEHDAPARLLAGQLPFSLIQVRVSLAYVAEVYGVKVTEEIEYGWQTLIVATSRADLKEVIDLLTPSVEAEYRLLADWVAVGPLGPLSFAAGLTVAEVRVQAAAGVLTTEGLAALAALRDWVFPPLLAELPLPDGAQDWPVMPAPMGVLA